jgi:hypothetical protein
VGTVQAGGLPVESGNVEFFATCPTSRANMAVRTAQVRDGWYVVTLPKQAGYRARIEVFAPNGGESYSWHSALGSCGTPFDATQDGKVNLVAAAPFLASGAVSATNGATPRGGQVEFYATCTDYQQGNLAGSGAIVDGQYEIAVPKGQYKAFLKPSTGAAWSWHDARLNCDSADLVSVLTSGVTRDLVAMGGVGIAGSVTSSRGSVEYAYVYFYSSCAAFEAQTPSGFANASRGRYEAQILPGNYVVYFDPEDGRTLKSWHSAKADCAQATPVTVGPAGGTIDLVALGKPKRGGPVGPTPPPVEPTPGPTVTPVKQTVKKPPAKLKKGKKAKLAKRTRQGQKLTWKTKTRKVCTVKKYVVRAKKKGKCKLSASAPATPAYLAFKGKYVVKVR